MCCWHLDQVQARHNSLLYPWLEFLHCELQTKLWLFQVGASTVQRLSQHRRDLLKPHVREKYERLCNRPDKEGPELLGGSDIEEKISSMGKTQSIGKKGDFLGQRLQRGGKGEHHSSSNRHYKRPQNNWNSAGSQYNSRYRSDGPNNHRAGGKMRHHAGEGQRKAPYHKKWNNNRWRKN